MPDSPDLSKLLLGLAHRVADQSELLSKRAERQMSKTIHEHEGKKYLRTIWAVGEQTSIDGKLNKMAIQVDVYAVLEAFVVTCPATAHALKKLLCAGQRSKGSRLDDLLGADAALCRAIELERIRSRLEAVEIPNLTREESRRRWFILAGLDPDGKSQAKPEVKEGETLTRADSSGYSRPFTVS